MNSSSKPIALQVGDRVRTGERSRATINSSGALVIRLDELTLWELRKAEQPERPGVEVDLARGLMYFLSREGQRKVRVRTPSSVGALRGTEFTVQVDANGRTVYTMLAGRLGVNNRHGELEIASGQAAEVVPGQAPRLRAVIDARRVVQWLLYYPAVVDSTALKFTPEEREAMAASLAAYEAGDVLAAFERFPWGHQMAPESDAAVFRAALLLTTGQVEDVEADWGKLGDSPESLALKRLVQVVTGADRGKDRRVDLSGPNDRRQSNPDVGVSEEWTASEFLAASYEQQAIGRLPDALAMATRATILSPSFGYAWTRRAELAFALGKRREATASLQQAMQHGPRNAQAWALQGFVASSMQRWDVAASAFATATQLDGSLGNGWLGLGLLAFRQGDTGLGRRYLLMAAAQEPDRSLLRSYLARGLAEDGDLSLAAEEADRGKQLDPMDPTPWLYSSLIQQRQGDYRDGIRELEESLRLNRNRRLFRSELQLAQDEALRRTNLANLYSRVGMEERSVQQAAWAVLGDYTNADAHLFLANSYGQLRDPFGIELEYDAAWQNEILLANLLSPAGAGVVSRGIGLQEYGPFFVRPGASGQFRGRYQDNGDWLLEFDHQQRDEQGSLALSLGHRELNGYRTNNDARQSNANLLLKRQISTQDAIFLELAWSSFSGGDLLRVPLNELGRPDLDFNEEFFPSLRIGVTHRWDNDAATILLAGYHEARQTFADKDITTISVNRNGMGTVIGTAPLSMDVQKSADIDLFSAQFAHIQQFGPVQLVAGAEYQTGNIKTHDTLSNPPPPVAPFFDDPPADSSYTESLEHASVYAYATWQISDALTLQGGLTYDWLRYPENYRTSPITPGDDHRDDLSFKCGLLWQPCSTLSFWSAYAESVGGITFEESISLEPSQTVGMLHNFRSLISESLVGSLTAPEHEITGAGISWQACDDLYLDLGYRWRSADVDRLRGAFTLQGPPPLYPDSTPETLDYDEYQIGAKLTWLLGKQCAASLGYTWTHAELEQDFTGFPASGGVPAGYSLESDFHEVEARLQWNHPSGIFGEASGRFLSQNNSTFGDENNVIVDLAAGYAPAGQGGRFRLGVLNATDSKYNLNPLTDRSIPVTERTFFVEYVYTY